ncbi:hypothetical protein HPB50_017986 [Hyalomma asiaticum]|uniref:Uncharacterized protein n=1 Tax=Hyalomma asiaticum TaxID=266040 RepID=A0ACB7T8U6_HYAAI|nr:hypothetical protein HPB50_017986 [Hyalomma asiaticum]
MSECEDMSSQEEECGGSKNTPANAARAELSHNLKPMPLESVEVHPMSDLMECPVKTEPPDDEILMDCSNCCDTVLEDITVSQLLGMCNSKEASEALMAEEESRARPIKTERCEEPAEEVSHQEIKPSFMPEEQPQASVDEPDCEVLAPSSKPEERAQATSHKPDYVVPAPSLEPEERAEAIMDNSGSVAFELPSFGIFDNLLRAQVPANYMMQRHILHGLFEALAKTTLYPTKAQLKEAVDSLIHKYPHLSSMKGKTGKEFWMNALMNKFSGHRAAMADSILIPERPQRSCVAKRTQRRDESGSAQHFLRPLRLGEQPSGDKDEVPRQGKRRASAAAGGRVDNHERERAALERHSATSEMTVEEIIFTFPVFRNESSLLEEFKVLWSTDIADCFEEGIKKLFLVLMNCGTNKEMRAISQPGNDVLLVVLNAIAMRCGEELNSVLVKGNALPTPCLVTCNDKSIDVFFNGSRLFVASSLLGGLCSLFASFWLFQREYSVCSQGVMTFLEHAFLNLNHTTPGPKCRMFIDLYRRVADIDSPW